MPAPRAIWLVIACIVACAHGANSGVAMDVYGNLVLTSMSGKSCTCNNVDLLATIASLQNSETSLEAQLSATQSTGAVLASQACALIDDLCL